jgi:hypothetical protein
MNNKVIGAVAAVVVIGLIVYFATANKSNNPEELTQSQTQETNQQQNPPAKSSLRDLVASGSQTCTYKEGDNEGTVYTADGKARMDMTTVASGVAMSSHAIIDGNTYYSWVDGQPNGFKFSFDPSVSGSAAGSGGPNQNVDLNQQFNSSIAQNSLLIYIRK